MSLRSTGALYMDTRLSLVATSARTRLAGLLADADGSAVNDLRLRDGSLVPTPRDDASWRAYASSWRISNSESLFTYPAGADTSTFTDLAFPGALTTMASLTDLQRQRGMSARQAAE